MNISLQLKVALLFFGVMLVSALIALVLLVLIFNPIMRQNSENQVLSVASSVNQLSQIDALSETEIRSLLSITPVSIDVVDSTSEFIEKHKYEIRLNNYYVETTGLFPSSTAYMKLGSNYIAISGTSKDNNYWVIYFVVILSFIICIVLGTFITIIITRYLLRPINDLSRAAAEVARGNFYVRVSEKGAEEYRTLQKNFNRMAEELSGTETLRGDFISNVSHEFKTPLASIQGFAKLLQNDSISAEERTEYTQIIIDETVRLSKLATNILNLSKLENQTTIANKTRFSLDEQIRRIILMLEPEWSKKNIDLDIALDEVYYYGNEDLMGQIWQNIINNAIKFTPVNGSIIVHLFRSESNITARISDNGPSISKAMQEKIFEKFYQGDHSRKTEGNGLGLALVKRIVDLCGGKVFVENLFEGGVCFVVELPFVIDDMMS
ncbi:Signal transduction histidine kinase [Ruminococcaceae bacterium FB2012]|nr:Signal transduction histidine kinase [Ruminococcaceae bacterium FB2012]